MLVLETTDRGVEQRERGKGGGGRHAVCPCLTVAVLAMPPYLPSYGPSRARTDREQRTVKVARTWRPAPLNPRVPTTVHRPITPCQDKQQSTTRYLLLPLKDSSGL
ncbi:hypothetical protein ACOMHN_062081 [Nucella lapillus]